MDRQVGSIAAAPALTTQLAAAAAPRRGPQAGSPGAAVRDEQMLTDIEDALTSPSRRVHELRALDAMTTPPELQEASFIAP